MHVTENVIDIEGLRRSPNRLRLQPAEPQPPFLERRHSTLAALGVVLGILFALGLLLALVTVQLHPGS